MISGDIRSKVQAAPSKSLSEVRTLVQDIYHEVTSAGDAYANDAAHYVMGVWRDYDDLIMCIQEIELAAKLDKYLNGFLDDIFITNTKHLLYQAIAHITVLKIQGKRDYYSNYLICNVGAGVGKNEGRLALDSYKVLYSLMENLINETYLFNDVKQIRRFFTDPINHFDFAWDDWEEKYFKFGIQEKDVVIIQHETSKAEMVNVLHSNVAQERLKEELTMWSDYEDIEGTQAIIVKDLDRYFITFDCEGNIYQGIYGRQSFEEALYFDAME
jgi:hypothetical protein